MKMSLPASSSIPPPAAIYECKTLPQDTEVSDVPVDNNDDNTSDEDDDDDNNGSSTERSNNEETEDAAFHRAAREIMNQAGQRV